MSTAASPRSLGTLRMILHAAARMVGCDSAQMALLDEERRRLVLRVAIATRDVPTSAQVAALLGFEPDGASFPIDLLAGTLFVRAVREGRLLVTGRFAELVGDLVPPEVSAQVQSLIGPQSFAVVPVMGRSRPVGVILFQKPGNSGFAPSDRDLLVAYADRIGVDLESQALTQEVAALESFAQVDAPPPAAYLCDEGGATTGSDGARRPLAEVLGVTRETALLDELRRSEGSRTLVVHTDDGRPLRLTHRRSDGAILVVVEEVGWIERLSREAARARSHLERVLANVGDAVFTVDVQGTIVGCNETVHGMLGRPSAELLGQPVAELYADRRSQQRAAGLLADLRREGFAAAELSFRRADGRAVPAAVSALLLYDDQQQPAGFLLRLRDLSAARRGDAERRRLRARLLQSERLSALGEMAARIAHEVRNPLVSISATALLIDEELPPGSPLHDDVRAIAREVQRLDGIVSDFLRFARPRRAQSSPVDVAAVLRETVEMVRAKAPELAFVVASEAGVLPVPARVDADGLRQVLWNVLLNAVEASPPGGAIDCDLRRRAGQVVLSVADRGPGIPPHLRRRVLDPFFSTKARGTGLGLAVCRQIVDEHRGRLRLLRRPQGGTRVVIELPGGLP